MDLGQRIFYQVSFHGLGRLITENIIPTEGRGEENVPADRSALIVCNHRVWIDPFFLVLAGLERQPTGSDQNRLQQHDERPAS